MKLVAFSLTLMLFTSCSTREVTLQVCSTGEKLIMYNDVYTLGDTVMLQQTVDELGELAFEIDNNWISFPESHKYLDETGYYKSIVLGAR